MKEPVLQINDLHFSYRSEESGTSKILHGINLCVNAGELIAIQGSSGSGKSTLLYILGCLLLPDQGQILLDGHDISQLSRDELAWLRNRTIGFVFQQFHLLPRASVLQNILLPTQYPCE